MQEAHARALEQSPSKRGADESTDTWLMYVVFDLLYLQGGEHEATLVREAHSSRPDQGCISGLPLHCRRALLTSSTHWY